MLLYFWSDLNCSVGSLKNQIENLQRNVLFSDFILIDYIGSTQNLCMINLHFVFFNLSVKFCGQFSKTRKNIPTSIPLNMTTMEMTC